MGILERHEDKWCPEPNTGCYLWTGYVTGPKGHKRPVFRSGGKCSTVSRVVCEEYHGPPPTHRHEALHKCDVGMCVNPDHVRWGTRAENELDKRRKNPNWGLSRNSDGWVCVRVDGTHDVNGKYIGMFKTWEDAIRARDLYQSRTSIKNS